MFYDFYVEPLINCRIRGKSSQFSITCFTIFYMKFDLICKFVQRIKFAFKKSIKCHKNFIEIIDKI